MTPEQIKQQIMKSANLSVRAIQEEVDFSDAQNEYNLGISYLHGINVEQNSKKAFKCFRALAEQGETHALASLGWAFYTGTGVEQNYEEAVKWYRAAAEQGNADAQNGLGICYLKGQGVDQNFEESAKWCRASAEQGDSSGQDTLGDCYRDWEGAGQNLEEAAKWYRASAEQGNSYGQNNLGECYRDGLGAERNLQEATKWFRAAAEQGHDQAKANLQALEQSTKNSPPSQPPPVPEQGRAVATADLKTVEPSIPISSPVEPPSLPVKALEKRIPANTSTQPTSLGVVMHLLGFTGLFFPFGNILAPLILWLVKRGDSSYLDFVGKEAINFQISYTIYLTVSLILCKVWIGLILFPIVGLMWIIFMVVAAAKSGSSKEYRYPLTIRFLKR